MAIDWDALLERICSDAPPTTTVYLRLYANAPVEGNPVVLRLLTGEQDSQVRTAVAALKTEEEKAAAWIRQPLIHALVSIDGVPVPEDLAQRAKLVGRLPDPVITELFRAYQTLEADELSAQQQLVDQAHNPNSSGAGFGSQSAPDSGNTSDPRSQAS